MRWLVLLGAVAGARALACAPGYYGSPCQPCPLGRFAALPGAAECEPCPIGTNAPRMGMKGCSDCVRGTFAAEIATIRCDACPLGRYSAAPGASSCAECPAGRFAGAQQGALTASYFQTSAAKCDVCPGGQWRALGTPTDQCTECAPGQYRAGNADAATRCQPCAAGTFARMGSRQCAACDKGQYQDDPGAYECKACRAGEYQDAPGAASGCKTCAEGTSTALVGAVACRGCAAGQFKENTNVDQDPLCTQCPHGKYKPAASDASCTACAPGRHTVAHGQTECAQSDCAAGRYSTPRGCRGCPSGKHAPLRGSHTSCQTCAPPFYQHDAGQAACYESHCAAGRYQNPKSRDNCLLCPLGQHTRAVGQPSCTPCPAGTKGAYALGATSAGRVALCKAKETRNGALWNERPDDAPQAPSPCSHLTCKLERAHFCETRELLNDRGPFGAGLWTVGCHGKTVRSHGPPAGAAAAPYHVAFSSIKVFHHGHESKGVRHRCSVSADHASCSCTCWTDARPTTSTAAAAPTTTTTTRSPSARSAYVEDLGRR